MVSPYLWPIISPNIKHHAYLRFSATLPVYSRLTRPNSRLGTGIGKYRRPKEGIGKHPFSIRRRRQDVAGYQPGNTQKPVCHLCFCPGQRGLFGYRRQQYVPQPQHRNRHLGTGGCRKGFHEHWRYFPKQKNNGDFSRTLRAVCLRL